MKSEEYKFRTDSESGEIDSEWFFIVSYFEGECNTILSAYALYRRLG